VKNFAVFLADTNLEFSENPKFEEVSFPVIADILHKEKHADVRAKFLERGIKPILRLAMEKCKFDDSTINITCDALAFKSTVLEKPHVPRGSVLIKCPIAGCKYETYMQKKLFDALPKSKGFPSHLDFGQDYMVWYQNEGHSESFSCTDSRKVPKFLNELKKHFKDVHRDLLDDGTAPLVIRSCIYFRDTLKKKGCPTNDMMKLIETFGAEGEKKAADVGKVRKRGRPKKQG
jgi:hypothetical protein